MTLPRKFNFTLAGARRRRRARRASSARRLRLPSHGRNAFNWPWSGSLKENLPVEDRRPETRSATKNGARERSRCRLRRALSGSARADPRDRPSAQSARVLLKPGGMSGGLCSRVLAEYIANFEATRFRASAMPNSWRFIGDTRQRIRDSPGNER